jgi:hypothetical protein
VQYLSNLSLGSERALLRKSSSGASTEKLSSPESEA